MASKGSFLSISIDSQTSSQGRSTLSFPDLAFQRSSFSGLAFDGHVTLGKATPRLCDL